MHLHPAIRRVAHERDLGGTVAVSDEALGVDHLLAGLGKVGPEGKRTCVVRRPHLLKEDETADVGEDERLADHPRGVSEHGSAGEHGGVQGTEHGSQIWQRREVHRRPGLTREQPLHHDVGGVSFQRRLGSRSPVVVILDRAHQRVQVRALVLQSVNQLVHQHRL